MLGRGTIAGCLAALLLLTSVVRPNPAYRAATATRNASGRAVAPLSERRWFQSQSSQPQPPLDAIRRRTSPATPETGSAAIRICRPHSSAARSKTIRSSAGFPRNSKRGLQNRLQHFSSLPPQQQERVLNRMETWEHLTPDQKQQARQLFQQFKQLPPDRRQAVNRAIRGMRGLTPEQRDQLINSDQYRNQFSPQERGLLGGASHLPLAPGDGLLSRTVRIN